MPVPVHPDDPLARCAFCPSVFLARNALDRAFIERHEEDCPENPDAVFADARRNWRTPATGSFGITQVVSSATVPIATDTYGADFTFST